MIYLKILAFSVLEEFFCMLLYIAIDIDHRKRNKRYDVNDRRKTSLGKESTFAVVCEINSKTDKEGDKRRKRILLLNALTMNFHESISPQIRLLSPFQVLVKNSKVHVSIHTNLQIRFPYSAKTLFFFI